MLNGAAVLLPCMPTRAAEGSNSGKSEAPKKHENVYLVRKAEEFTENDTPLMVKSVACQID